jgi:glycosyltransferase involved in cell wall biosynthesis
MKKLSIITVNLNNAEGLRKTIESVVFQAKESKTLDSSDQQIEELIVELITNHTIG